MNSFIFILIFQGAKIDNHEQFTYKILAEKPAELNGKENTEIQDDKKAFCLNSKLERLSGLLLKGIRYFCKRKTETE